MLQALPHRVWTARSHRASVRSRCPTVLTLRSKAIYIMPTSPQDHILTLLSRDDSCIIAISKHTLILPLISPPFFYLFIYPSNPDTQHLYSKRIFHLLPLHTITMAKSTSNSQRSRTLKSLPRPSVAEPTQHAQKLIRGTKHHCGGENAGGKGKCHLNGGGICTRHQAVCLVCKRVYMAHRQCFCARAAAEMTRRPVLGEASGNGKVKRKASRDLDAEGAESRN